MKLRIIHKTGTETGDWYWVQEELKLGASTYWRGVQCFKLLSEAHECLTNYNPKETVIYETTR